MAGAKRRRGASAGLWGLPSAAGALREPSPFPGRLDRPGSLQRVACARVDDGDAGEPLRPAGKVVDQKG